jgi:hypothetical protein
MIDELLQKINHIEKLLTEIDAKIDNFLGFEELNDEEKKEISKLREEVSRDEYVSYKDVFSD